MYETANASMERTNEPECAARVECLEFSVTVHAFKAFVNDLASIAYECKITIEPIDGLKVRVVDPAHIAMVDTGIAIEVFEKWTLTPSNAYIGSFGVDLEKLKVYLKAFKAKDKDTVLSVKVDMVARKMTIDGPTGSRVISLIDDTGMSDLKVPNMGLPTEIVVKDAKLFRSALKMASEISDYIAMRYDGGDKSLWLECEGDMDKMATKVEVEVVKSETTTVQKTIDGEVQSVQTEDSRSVFALEYLVKLTKDLPNGFRICMGNNYPLKIAVGKTVKLLAPRIESDDDDY